MQPQNSAEALAQLQKYQSTAQNPNQILTAERGNLGVDKAQETVTGLRGAINNTTNLLKQVAPSIMGRTGSSLVTNAQAVGQIQNAQAPIAQNLSEQGNQYGLANQDLSQLQTRASENASGIYQGQQDQQSYLSNLYNTLYGRETEATAAQERERDRQESIRQFNEQLNEARNARAASSRQFDLSRFDAKNASVASTPTAISQNDKDAQYLGRLMSEADGVQRVELIAGLRKQAKAGNAEALRKFNLGKQLGYWKF